MSKNNIALLVVAHGSRRDASNDEVRKLVELISIRPGILFKIVKPAFLELASPSITEGIEQCIKEGASEIVVFPYFLSAGRHVTEDVPKEVDLKRKEYPQIPIKIANYLGSNQGIADLVLELVT